MRVMPSNHTSLVVGWLAGRKPGSIGHLYSPGGQRGPWDFIPYALDNGAFPAWEKGEAFNADAWRELLSWADSQRERPLWVAVPDVVTNREATLEAWAQYAPEAKQLGAPLAFVVQDGMTPRDVPLDASVVFVGGSTAWKWGTLPMWATHFPKVHVGRVNGWRGLMQCDYHKVQSCDGTGWFRGDKRQTAALIEYVLHGNRQMALELVTEDEEVAA